ncbi:MAG TPA: transcription termination factor NusA [Kofleriaceae bacterium]
MDAAKLDVVLDQVGRDKNIDKSVLINALEQAILTAAKRTFGLNREMEAKFNAETGSVDLFLIINVVDEDDAIEGREITVSEATKVGLEAELGDELLFQVFYRAEDDDRAREQDEKFGQLIDLKNASKKFGRIAAQTAKQVIYQRVREAERDNVYNEFKDRKGEIISGAVRRFERGALVVDVGKAEAVLPMREQVPRESYRVGDTIKAYCLDIDRNARGPQVIMSRTHKGLLEKLFEQEVPEIFEKIVRIESSAREPGARAKIAVSSRDRDVDPVGACVGMKGSRVQAVVQELRGEKIDIVPYDDDPARFVCNAIAPAEVSRVIIDAEGHRMELIVPDDKLSLAIGKKGQNVRLASQLTGWRIDIHSESKIYELERRAKEQIAQAIDAAGLDGHIADHLFKLGWRSVGELGRAHVDELAGVPGISGADGARRVIDAAQHYMAAGGRRRDDARKEAERRSVLTGSAQLLELDGVDEEVLGVLAAANIHSPEDLIKTPIESIATSTGIDMGDLARLRQRAISWLSEVSS